MEYVATFGTYFFLLVFVGIVLARDINTPFLCSPYINQSH